MTVPEPDASRRNERSHRAILKSTAELIARNGYEKVSIEAIARHAGVGKQTIYRWWPSKGAVAHEALIAAAGLGRELQYTGDLMADLRRQSRALHELLANTEVGPLLQALIAAAQSDPELLAQIKESYGPVTQSFREQVALAQQAGEIRHDVDVEALIELLDGAVFYRLLLEMRPFGPGSVETTLDILFNGLRPR